MAEARREDESEAERDRNYSTGRPDRTKPEHLHSSAGPLSSIRAAIKRTRTNSQGDARDRRRPEITIVSAEPLVSTTWFSGSSVVFPPPPPSLAQPPPSYDQVIQEKTKEEEEHVVRPTAAPRWSSCSTTPSTTTSATQTEPEQDDTNTSSVAAAAATVNQPSAEGRPAGKKPKKPPRPSLPKQAEKGPVTKTDSKTNTDDQTRPDIKPPSQSDPSPSCTRSVTVHWDLPDDRLSAETTPSPPNTEPHQCPVPLPRRKPRRQSFPEEVKVQSLVRLSDDCDVVPRDPDPEDLSSNKYLQELLEVFGGEVEESEGRKESDEALLGEDAAGEMSDTNNQRNIRARIQAFESQVEEGTAPEPLKPEPRPRKAKPPVAVKPSVALKPQFNPSAEDVYQNVPSANSPQILTPDPRPAPPKKPGSMRIKEELEAIHSRGSVNRSRQPLLTRAENFDMGEVSPLPPVPPVKPIKEPLRPNMNINNHNSTSVFSENMYVNAPLNHTPVEPLRNMDSNVSVTRRPTTIRVPSKTASFCEDFQDSPPPLPVQKPVGTTNPSLIHKQMSTPTFPSQDFSQFGPEPSLPPRRHSTIKSLPPRPPPAKAGPGRPPPPSLRATGRSHTVAWDVAPKPQAQKPQGKRPVLPPRPNPGHRLYNKYTLELPHGIACVDYNGSNTGELSLQKNEVLLLIGETDPNTFECQVGDIRGPVHKSRVMVVTPLSSDVSSSQSATASTAAGDGYGMRVQVLHDFNPEGPGELGLKSGDVVTMVETVDTEWYRGTCRGSTGFFPVNYVKVLSNSPKTLPKRKSLPSPAAVSGPRGVARFDFEGEHSDELSFSEGDVIQLKEYIGDDWARGRIGANAGIFPLNFVEIVEDLPPPPPSQKQQTLPRGVPLPGMVASQSANIDFAQPAQAPQSGVDWVVALYDYAGKSEGDLSFRQGDRILLTQHMNQEWSSGRLNGREGMFPRAYVECSRAVESPFSSQQSEPAAAGGERGRAMFNFSSDCDEELSLQVGDILTNLENVDDEWFLGDLRGKRALVPKNYVQVL